MEYVTNQLVVQGVKAIDLLQQRTRLAKLVCRHIDIDSLLRDGKILPKPTRANSNEHLDYEFSESPVGPGQQPFDNVIEASTNAVKRRRISGNEGLQTLTRSDTLRGDKQNYIFGVLEDWLQSSPNTLDEVPEYGSAMREVNSAQGSNEIGNREDENDNELPSVIVRNVRIGEQLLGDLDLFTQY
jgi:hypothetical protein